MLFAYTHKLDIHIVNISMSDLIARVEALVAAYDKECSATTLPSDIYNPSDPDAARIIRRPRPRLTVVIPNTAVDNSPNIEPSAPGHVLSEVSDTSSNDDENDSDTTIDESEEDDDSDKCSVTDEIESDDGDSPTVYKPELEEIYTQQTLTLTATQVHPVSHWASRPTGRTNFRTPGGRPIPYGGYEDDSPTDDPSTSHSKAGRLIGEKAVRDIHM
jgi:hypothetical protein